MVGVRERRLWRAAALGGQGGGGRWCLRVGGAEVRRWGHFIGGVGRWRGGGRGVAGEARDATSRRRQWRRCAKVAGTVRWREQRGGMGRVGGRRPSQADVVRASTAVVCARQAGQCRGEPERACVRSRNVAAVRAAVRKRSSGAGTRAGSGSGQRGASARAVGRRRAEPGGGVRVAALRHGLGWCARGRGRPGVERVGWRGARGSGAGASGVRGARAGAE